MRLWLTGSKHTFGSKEHLCTDSRLPECHSAVRYPTAVLRLEGAEDEQVPSALQYRQSWHVNRETWPAAWPPSLISIGFRRVAGGKILVENGDSLTSL